MPSSARKIQACGQANVPAARNRSASVIPSQMAVWTSMRTTRLGLTAIGYSSR